MSVGPSTTPGQAARATAHRGLTERSATELARMIRSGDVTSRAVVEAHLARLDQYEPTVNAVVAQRRAAALEEADAADARVRAAADDEELPPLLGVPCSIKESIGVKGMPNTAGFPPAADRVAGEDAVAVDLVRRAGAIPIALTNTSELCLWIEAKNPIYGRTSNPYSADRTVGGSSGGEGAVIGYGGSPFGLGSDLAGSIRIPAFCCGIFGHKPSTGVVPTTGHFPMGTGPSRRMMVMGPLARRAEDLHPLMQILNHDDPLDPFDREIPLGDPADVDIEGLRVVVLYGVGATFLTSRELIAARQRAIDHLASRGANIVTVPPYQSARLAAKVTNLFIESLRSAWDDEFTTSIGWEVERVRDMYRSLARKEDQHTTPFVHLSSLTSLTSRIRKPVPPERLGKAIDKLADQVSALLGDGVMLTPTMPQPAPPHGWTTLRPLSMQAVIAANLFGWPATQIPVGFTPEGLPLGLQAIAGRDQDHRTIAVAIELEKAFGGWVPPERAGKARMDVPGRLALLADRVRTPKHRLRAGRIG